MRKKRQFTRHEESTRAAGVAQIDQPEKWTVQTGLILMIKDLQIVREDAEKRGVPKTIPASEGLDAL